MKRKKPVKASSAGPEAGPATRADAEAEFGEKATDLDALQQAVADAAKVGSTLWLSYIFLLFFLLVAVGSVSHRDLLLASPVALPFLSVNLPLVAFFSIGPALFLVAHAYVLLHFVLLADKVGAFHRQLLAQVSRGETREQIRRQLPSDIFAQSLAGPRDIREGTIGFMLKMIAWISLVVGPLILLVLFQLQFLAYHDWAVTWWHRIAVAIDLVLLWRLWPSIAIGAITTPSLALLKRSWGAALASLVPLVFVFTIATYPGEWLNGLPSIRIIPWKCSVAAPPTSISVHDLLIGGVCDPRVAAAVWPNRLLLVNFDRHVSAGTRPGQEAQPQARLDLSSRNLEGMVMIGGNLRRANLTAANLRGANLIDVDLQEAMLTTARLSGASMFQVRFQEANLSGAELQGASLGGANFSGTVFSGTRMMGASLDNANLRGASLYGVRLEGASLRYARLEGAMADGTNFIGAALDGAHLQGASLRGAQLQGATFAQAELVGTDLGEAHLWRAAEGQQNTVRADRLGRPNWQPTYRPSGQGMPQAKSWSAAAYADLVKLVKTEVPDGSLRNDALNRIKVLACDRDPCTFDDRTPGEMQNFRRVIDAAVVGLNPMLQALTETLGDQICAVPELEALKGMMRNGRIRWATNAGPQLLNKILSPGCPAAKLLSPEMRAELEALYSR